MKIGSRRLLIGLGIVLAVIGIFTVEFLSFGGQFRTIPPRAPGPCDTLALEASAEDIQIDRNRSIAYLSALDRRALVRGEDVRGTVLQLDLASTSLQPRPALASAPENFRPHGMALYQMGDGKQRLFVISHPPGEPHVIEIFEQGADGLFGHIGSIRDPLLQSPNAIVAVGPQQFYVANDKGASGLIERIFESAFRSGMSKIVYYDGQTMRIAADELKSAVGLGLSPDGLRIAVAETLGKRVTLFARDPASGTLTLESRVELDGAPDNINVDTDGTLWIAMHARLLDLIRHFGDPDHPAPTTVLRYTNGVTELVYAEDGSALSAGSVGAAFGGRLLMGSITEPELRICRLR